MLVSEVFEGLWLVNKSRWKLTGNRLEIQLHTILSNENKYQPSLKLYVLKLRSRFLPFYEISKSKDLD